MLVALDDSIVRGTTLKKSILKSWRAPSRARSSSARPLRRSVTRTATASTWQNRPVHRLPGRRGAASKAGRQSLLDRVYEECREEMKKPAAERRNRVQGVYADFTDEEVSAEISRMVYPESIDWKGEVQVIFQTIENLRASIKGDCGDWYFTGDYPTAGGYAMGNNRLHPLVRRCRRPQVRSAASDRRYPGGSRFGGPPGFHFTDERSVCQTGSSPHRAAPSTKSPSSNPWASRDHHSRKKVKGTSVAPIK
ncbi:MAG: hypothetical protein QM755_24335 [Luteolibacter sp.]